MKLASIDKVLPIFCKDSANESNESVLSDCRVQSIFCKDKNKFREVVFFRVIYCHKRDFWYPFVCQYIRLLFKGGLFVFKRSLLCGANKASLRCKQGLF